MEQEHEPDVDVTAAEETGEAPADSEAVDSPEAEPEAEAEPVAKAKVFPPRRNLGAGRASAVTEQAVTSGGLAGSRAAHWHQDGAALLTREALAAWIERCGLVFYTSRSQQMGAPAPSLVEAVAGSKDGEAAAAATALLAALVAEGTVVPLNLLGVTGAAGTDVPDFVCSAAVFSFVFTLRGNKAWKTAPATAGAVKVSPLALAAYEALVAKGAMTAYDLTTELGKEVTGAAVLRALNELWAQLRVLPLPAVDSAETRWELASARFMRQIKAGANAGQPTALSALISLYLGQALAAEETEIESFLSPLAPRSRIREVLHALLAARQLETLVIDGKTLLHVTGAAPVGAVAAEETGEADEPPAAEGGSRIAKFAPKAGAREGKLGTGLRAKAPGARPSSSAGPRGGKPAYGKPAFGRPSRPAFGRAGADAGGERERRPFRKTGFDKPWEERPARPANAEGGERPPRREFSAGREGAGERGAGRPAGSFSKRPGFSKGPGFGAGRDGAPPLGGSRPPYARSEGAGGEGRPPRAGGAGGAFKRPYAPRPRPEGGEERTRPAFGKPAFGAGRPPAGNFAARRPGPGATGAFPSRPRPDAGGEGEAPRKVYRKFDAPREGKPYKAKPFGAKSADRSFAPRRDAGSAPPRREGGSDRPARSGPPRDRGDRPSGGRPPGRPAGPGRNASVPARKSASGGAGLGPFAKFAGGNKRPFSKAGGRPGAKPGGGSRGPAAGGPKRGADGGFAPTRRKRPEDGE